jgi:hypothetical protein
MKESLSLLFCNLLYFQKLNSVNIYNMKEQKEKIETMTERFITITDSVLSFLFTLVPFSFFNINVAHLTVFRWHKETHNKTQREIVKM